MGQSNKWLLSQNREIIFNSKKYILQVSGFPTGRCCITTANPCYKFFLYIFFHTSWIVLILEANFVYQKMYYITTILKSNCEVLIQTFWLNMSVSFLSISKYLQKFLKLELLQVAEFIHFNFFKKLVSLSSRKWKKLNFQIKGVA